MFSVTTNGTIMTPRIIDFLAENDFRLVVSVDGPEEVHNKNRRYAKNGAGTFQYVYANLIKIRNQKIELYNNILISAVVEPDVDPNLSVDYFENDPIFQPLEVMINSVSDDYIDDIYVQSEEYDCYEKTKEFKEIVITNNDKLQFCL